LGLDEEFFGVNDVYRDAEMALMWEKSERLDLGAGWRWYVAGFESPRLKAYQAMQGIVGWLRFKF
jgi:hypothetical protein